MTDRAGEELSEIYERVQDLLTRLQAVEEERDVRDRAIARRDERIIELSGDYDKLRIERDEALKGGEGFWGRAAARLITKLAHAEQRVAGLEKAVRWAMTRVDQDSWDYLNGMLTPPPSPRQGGAQ